MNIRLSRTLSVAILVALSSLSLSANGFLDAVARAGNEIANWNAVPIENLPDQSFRLKAGASAIKVISQAAKEFGRMYGGTATVTEKGAGEAVCEFSIRTHTATVKLAYGEDKFSLTYVSSVNLNYDSEKGTIHPNYNRWVKDLAAKITACAAAGREADITAKTIIRNAKDRLISTGANAVTNAVNSAVPVVPRATDAKTRLEQLKKLRDDGLLTEEEYKAKRAEVIATL